MANVIIGIHGLKNKPPKKVLERWWMLAMQEGLNNINHNGKLPKFELVYWADILYSTPLDINEKDSESINYVSEPYILGNPDFKIEDHSTRQKVVDFINKQLNKIFLNKDYSLNYSFISDAIISRFFKDLEIYYHENIDISDIDNIKIKDLIVNRLVKVISKYKDDRIMIVSHSMGSIIAFDVLTFYLNNIPIDTFITMGSPLGLPAVMSKIAAENKKAANNVDVMKTPPSITNHWYNFSDIMDKVALNYKLDDDFSSNDEGVKPIDFLIVNNYEYLKKKNPHKIYGYLRTPEFASLLSNFINSEKKQTRKADKLRRFAIRLKEKVINIILSK